MKRHAKASSAGTTQRQATGLGHIFGGVLATRGVSPRASGSGAPAGRRLALAGTAIALLLLAIAPTVASAASQPQTVSGQATAIATHSATLNGTVNPGGAELEECTFQYGPTVAYAQSAPCAESPASIGAGESPVPVHADLSGLSSSTDYHFRLRAKNALGTGFGSDLVFATLGPLVHGRSAHVLSDTSARLEAKIDPNGQATSYRFEYVSQAQFEASGYADATSVPPLPEAIGSGAADVEVSQQIGGLTPLGAYRFRVIATNPSGTVESERAFVTYRTPSSFEPCPNDTFRAATGANLPDCRAYEQVTPVDKDGNSAAGDEDAIRAAPDGQAFMYMSSVPMPAGMGPQYVATRSGGGWTSYWAGAGLFGGPSAWTEDLSLTLGRGFGGGYRLVQTLDGSFEALPVGEQFVGASADDSKVFLQAGTQFNVWDRDTHTLSPVGVLPNSACGTPPCLPAGGALGGSYNWVNGTDSNTLEESAAGSFYYTQDEHVVSTDGSRAYFTTAGDGQLYLRKNPAGPGAETVHVSASHRTVPDPNGPKPAAFLEATPDGSVALFTSPEELTDDATTGSADQGNDLYRFDAESGALTDLAPDPNPGDANGAEVKGVLGASEDGSYVYFAANGDLDGAGPAQAGDCVVKGVFNGSGLSASGSCSLYLAHAGQVTFISRLDDGVAGATDWIPSGFSGLGPRDAKARVSADGKTLLFLSQRQLTPYDSTPPDGACGSEVLVNLPRPCPELYRYSAAEDEILCVSCNPTGAAPFNEPTFTSISVFGGGGVVPFLTRNLSADGSRVFFETADKLAADDTNGDDGCPDTTGSNGPFHSCQDVYEWEAQGTGSCEGAAVNGGCLYLISTGASSRPSFFGDASRSGEDVFIYTPQQLVGQDEDELVDVYDARAGGGLASQNPSHPVPCEGEACKAGASNPSESESAGSASFTGPGNPQAKRRPSCPKGKRKAKVRGKTRCVAKPAKKKHKRNANKSRRASR